METNKILDADILDLLFDGRNKEYGAYDLRKHYNGRLGRAMAVTAGVVVALFCFGFVSGRGHVKAAPPVIVEPVQLSAVDNTPPPTPPPPRPQPQVATVKDVTIRIVPDKEVTKEDIPENKDVENVKIGTVNMAGPGDDGVVAPTADAVGKGIVEAPKKQDDDDGIARVVEIDASYPGGIAAWARFLHQNLHFPDDAVDKDIQGTVLVQFIVDKAGNVSDVEAVSGPADGGLREEAIRVIKRSGKWVPAIQNGRNVKSYKRQPVVFQLADQ